MKKNLIFLIILGILCLSYFTYSQTIPTLNQWFVKNDFLIPRINKVGTTTQTEFYAKKIESNSANIGVLNISGVALSPFIVTGTKPIILYSNGENSVFNGGVSFLYNVGIGTTTPSQRLEVYNGNIRINGGSLFLADVINQTPTQIFSYSNASSLWFVQPVTSPQLVLADAASWDRSVSITYIPGTTGGSSGILRIGQQFKNSTNYTHGITSFFTNGVEQVRINSSGNVGIGTINPTQKLDVSGNINVSGPYIYLNSGVGIFGISGSTTFLRSGSGQSLGFQTNGSEVSSLFINTSGNVGIGTTNPEAKLQINPGIAGQTNIDLKVYAPNDSNQGLLVSNGSMMLGYINYGQNSINYYTQNYVLTITPAAGKRSIAMPGFSFNTPSEWNLLNLIPNYGGLLVDFPNTAESTKTFFIRGRTMATTIGAEKFVILNNGDARFGYIYPGDSSVDSSTYSTQSSYYIRSVISGISIPIGNVGIGTTNPNEILSLWRNSGDINIKLNPNNTPVSGYIGRFQRNNDNVLGTSYYTYISNGAVHVNGSDENTFFVENQYVDAQIITMNRHGFRFLVADATSNNQNVTTTELMRLTFDGNVGIGTTTPSQKLTVAGNIGIQAGANSFIGTLDNYALSLRTNNADRIFITSSGNVGIGITSPTSKLHIYNSTGYNQLRLQTSYTPTGSSDSNGNVGDWAWDNDYIYVKTNSGWKRAALSSF